MDPGEESRPRIVVVGLGPAGPDLITADTATLLSGRRPVFLRTRRHPAAASIEAAASFDWVYEGAERFDDVYSRICRELVDRARQHGEIVYAVPGSPAVAERTVELLRARTDVDVDVRPALSFAELAWLTLGIDPMTAGAIVVDGHGFAAAAAGSDGPFLVTQVHSQGVLAAIVDAVADPGATVTVLQRLGLPDQRVEALTAADLVHGVDPDHLTSLYVDRLREPVAAAFHRFDELVRRLRAECPWDREQTHASLRQHLIEEAHEVLEALDLIEVEPDDGYPALEEELGDLLFQVFFHSRLASEQGRFTVTDVAVGIHDKLHGRHPHVFGDADADEIVAGWELAKQVEKARPSLLDGIPTSLPALLTALKVQKRAAATGFSGHDLEWALDDVRTELGEVMADPGEHEVGDLLYAAVQVARMLDVDPEHALARATRRFADRFRTVERLAAERSLVLADAPIEILEALWADAKEIERHDRSGRESP